MNNQPYYVKFKPCDKCKDSQNNPLTEDCEQCYGMGSVVSDYGELVEVSLYELV